MTENYNEGEEKDKPYVVEGGPVNIDSAHELIGRLTSSLETTETPGALTEEEVEELQDKLKTLYELQATLRPVPQEINIAIAQLIDIRNRNEGFKEAA